MARLVIIAVVLEGRSKSEVARGYGVSRRWVQKLVVRYAAEGQAAFEPRSRRPRASPQRTPAVVEDEIVALRKTLQGQGLDAGAATIGWHLARRQGHAPAVSTIWRVLSAAGSSSPSRTNGPAPPTSGSKPTSRTNAGSSTSPTGGSPTAPTPRSSTSSMNRPGVSGDSFR